MNVSIISILAGWIIFSTLLMMVIMVNSSRISHADRLDEHTEFNAGGLRKKRSKLASLIRMLIN